MDGDNHWYFAYGSNMQAATLRGRRRIEPLDARVGYLHGYRLCFDIPIGAAGRGVANLSVSADTGPRETNTSGSLSFTDGFRPVRVDRFSGFLCVSSERSTPSCAARSFTPPPRWQTSQNQVFLSGFRRQDGWASLSR